MTDRYDYPLPSLAVNIDVIEIETNGTYTGSFDIKNTGGGTLCGRIHSRCAGLVFNPANFDGNNQTIAYTFTAPAKGFDTGQTIESQVYITSNGGEVTLPVKIKLTKMSISTEEGIVITGLQDFYQYANAYPAQARRLFVDSDFYMLLLAIGYEYMEVYEALHKDANRERAIDNFFILSGLKGKTTLSIAEKKLEFIQKTNDNEMLYGHIVVEKSDNGYVEAPITAQGESSWLNFYASKLIQSDFKDALSTAVHFSVDPMMIKGAFAREVVTIGTEPLEDNTVEITYRRAAPIVVRLNRSAYGYADKGTIAVTNNTGKDMRVEVSCPESYIRFSARSYLIGASGEIPFNVKLSALLNAQLFFRKQPYMKTVIEVKSTMPGQVYNRQLPIIVGEW
ncbi:MAG: DUF5717 family protein [Firmicutes bacterium]|nr:DUF5717 family protein [Bacillota bacterium]